MKNRIFASLIASLLLCSLPIIAMDSSEEYSDEENTVEPERAEQSFFAAQLAGALELVSFGRIAAQSLFIHATRAEDKDRDSERGRDESPNQLVLLTPERQANEEFSDTLFNLFFNNPAAFNALMRGMPRDLNKLIARYLLHAHPLTQGMRRAIDSTLPTPLQDPDIISATFNRAGDKLVAIEAAIAKVWNAHTGECEKIFKGHTLQLTSACFNESGDQIVTTSYDKTARIWDVETGECRFILDHPDTIFVCSAQFNKAGTLLLTTDHTGVSRLWNATTGHLIHAFGDNIFSAQFDTRGSRIITTCSNKTVHILDAERLECVLTIDCPVSCSSLGRNNFLSQSDHRIIIPCTDGTVRIVEIESRRNHILAGHGSKINSARFNAAGDKAVTASDDGTARIWDTATGMCLHTLTTLSHDSVLPRALPHGINIAQLALLNPGVAARFNNPRPNPVLAAWFNYDGNSVITVTQDGIIQIWDVHSGRCLYTPQNQAYFHGISALSHAPNKICVGTNKTKIYNVDLCCWLERDCTLEQAMLLVCIYKYRLAPRVLRARGEVAAVHLLDFNNHPHFDEYFASMPAQIQELLSRFVIRKAPERNSHPDSQFK